MNAFSLRGFCRFAVVVFLVGFIAVVSSKTCAQPAAKSPEPLPAISAGSAVLMVDSSEGVGAADSELILQRRINTHIVTLRSEQNLRKMISNSNSDARRTKWFTSADNPRERTAWLRDHLRVEQVNGTPLIVVSLPDVADVVERRAILREVCETYLETAKAWQLNVLGDRTYMLNSVKLKVETRLKQLSDDMIEKANPTKSGRRRNRQDGR